MVFIIVVEPVMVIVIMNTSSNIINEKKLHQTKRQMI